ncbi:MAG: TetR/AcrR family transcriptional regulator [Candidatus Phaeomarinobacter sp.]
MVDTAVKAARDARKAEGQQVRAARIRDAARDILGEVGITGLTMRAVAARAGYTAGSVYSYFVSKEALLAALAVDEIDQLGRALRQQPDGSLANRADACVPVLRRVVPLLTAARRGDVPEDTERALTGRIIVILRLLDQSIPGGGPRDEDTSARALDTIGLWSALVGIALLSGSGRFASLNVNETDVTQALIARFT